MPQDECPLPREVALLVHLLLDRIERLRQGLLLGAGRHAAMNEMRARALCAKVAGIDPLDAVVHWGGASGVHGTALVCVVVWLLLRLRCTASGRSADGVVCLCLGGGMLHQLCEIHN